MSYDKAIESYCLEFLKKKHSKTDPSSLTIHKIEWLFEEGCQCFYCKEESSWKICVDYTRGDKECVAAIFPDMEDMEAFLRDLFGRATMQK